MFFFFFFVLDSIDIYSSVKVESVPQHTLYTASTFSCEETAIAVICGLSRVSFAVVVMQCPLLISFNKSAVLCFLSLLSNAADSAQ